MGTKTEKKITVPFTVWRDEETGLSFLDGDVPNVSAVYAASVETAAKALRDPLRKAIADGFKAEENGGRVGVIQTEEGSVFVVRWAYGGWCYDITGPGRKYGPAGCQMACKTFGEACERARSHAHGSFDGIRWECGTELSEGGAA
jgi:hypothetical protein